MDVKSITVQGKVEQQVVSAGSKSERAAVTLRTQSGALYVLRRQGGPAFVDPALVPLVGHWIEAEGLATDGTLIMRHWETIR